MPKIIFHYPGPFHERLDTGEKKRPVKLYQAFRDSGFDVTLVSGTYGERKKSISALLPELKKYDFIYSENTNLPLGLANEKRIPSFPNSDFKLFKCAVENKVRTAVFYRDIYWKFGFFRRETGLLKYCLGLPFYVQELLLYSKYADIVFVPSEEFASAVPFVARGKLKPMPPAEEEHDLPEPVLSRSCLNLLYVGSALPPVYDLSKLFASLSECGTLPVNLKIVTPEKSWKQASPNYKLPPNTAVCHAYGKELEDFYKNADIFLMCFNDNPYRKLCMPLKFFEALGFGLPILSFGETAVSRFVTENDIGWINGGGGDIFGRLLENPQEVLKKKKKVHEIRKQHTWKRRVEQITKIMLP